MDERRGQRVDRDVGERIVDAALRVHYAAHLLGPERPETVQLRFLADALHDLGKALKRG